MHRINGLYYLLDSERGELLAGAGVELPYGGARRLRVTCTTIDEAIELRPRINSLLIDLLERGDGARMHDDVDVSVIGVAPSGAVILHYPYAVCHPRLITLIRRLAKAPQGVAAQCDELPATFAAVGATLFAPPLPFAALPYTFLYDEPAALFQTPSIDQLRNLDRCALRLSARVAFGAEFELAAAATVAAAATGNAFLPAAALADLAALNVTLKYAVRADLFIADVAGRRELVALSRTAARGCVRLCGRRSTGPADPSLPPLRRAIAATDALGPFNHRPLDVTRAFHIGLDGVAFVPPAVTVVRASVATPHVASLERFNPCGGSLVSFGCYGFCPVADDVGLGDFIAPLGAHVPFAVQIVAGKTFAGRDDADAVFAELLRLLGAYFDNVPPAPAVQIAELNGIWYCCAPGVTYDDAAEPLVRATVADSLLGRLSFTASLLRYIPTVVYTAVPPLTVRLQRRADCPYSAAVQRHYGCGTSRWPLAQLRLSLAPMSVVRSAPQQNLGVGHRSFDEPSSRGDISYDTVPTLDAEPQLVAANALRWQCGVAVRRLAPGVFAALVASDDGRAVFITVAYEAARVELAAAPLPPPLGVSETPAALPALGSVGLIERRGRSARRIDHDYATPLAERLVAECRRAYRGTGPLNDRFSIECEQVRHTARFSREQVIHDFGTSRATVDSTQNLLVTVLKGPCGSGKSSHVREFIARKRTRRVVWVCPRVALVGDVIRALSSLPELAGCAVVDGRSALVRPSQYDNFVIVITIHSLASAFVDKYRELESLMFVFDELCLINEDLISQVLDTPRAEAALGFLLAGGRVSRCVLADANIDTTMVASFISRIADARRTMFDAVPDVMEREVDVRIRWVEASHQMASGRTVHCWEKSRLQQHILDHWIDRWALFFGSRTQLEAFESRLRGSVDQFGNTVRIKKFTRTARPALETLIDDLTADPLGFTHVFMYTTAAGVGVDLSFCGNSTFYRNVAVFGVEMEHMHPMTVFQGLSRARSVNQVYIAMDHQSPRHLTLLSPAEMIASTDDVWRRSFTPPIYELTRFVGSLALGASQPTLRQLSSAAQPMGPAPEPPSMNALLAEAWALPATRRPAAVVQRVRPIDYVTALAFVRKLTFGKFNFILALLIEAGYAIEVDHWRRQPRGNAETMAEMHRCELKHSARQLAAPPESLVAEYGKRCVDAGLSAEWATSSFTPAHSEYLDALSRRYGGRDAVRLLHMYEFLCSQPRPRGAADWRDRLGRLVDFSRSELQQSADELRVVEASQGVLDSHDGHVIEFLQNPSICVLAAVSLYQCALLAGAGPAPWPPSISTPVGDDGSRAVGYTLLDVRALVARSALEFVTLDDELCSTAAALLVNYVGVAASQENLAPSRREAFAMDRWATSRAGKSPVAAFCYAAKCLALNVRASGGTRARDGTVTTHFSTNERAALEAMAADFAVAATDNNAPRLFDATDDHRRVQSAYFQSVSAAVAATQQRIAALPDGAGLEDIVIPTESQSKAGKRKRVARHDNNNAMAVGPAAQ